MAGKDFEAFKQTIEQRFMGHPVVTQNAYTAWFAKGAVPLPHLRQFTTQFSVFSNQFLLAALNRAIKQVLRRAIKAEASSAITPWVFQRSRYAVRSIRLILS